jgi:hypothetical protein
LTYSIYIREYFDRQPGLRAAGADVSAVARVAQLGRTLVIASYMAPTPARALRR